MLSTGEPEEDSTRPGRKASKEKAPPEGQGQGLGRGSPRGGRPQVQSSLRTTSRKPRRPSYPQKKDGPAPAGPSIGLGTRLVRMDKAWPSISAAAGDARSTVICHNAPPSPGA